MSVFRLKGNGKSAAVVFTPALALAELVLPLNGKAVTGTTYTELEATGKRGNR